MLLTFCVGLATIYFTFLPLLKQEFLKSGIVYYVKDGVQLGIPFYGVIGIYSLCVIWMCATIVVIRKFFRGDYHIDSAGLIVWVSFGFGLMLGYYATRILTWGVLLFLILLAASWLWWMIRFVWLAYLSPTR